MHAGIYVYHHQYLHRRRCNKVRGIKFTFFTRAMSEEILPFRIIKNVLPYVRGSLRGRICDVISSSRRDECNALSCDRTVVCCLAFTLCLFTFHQFRLDVWSVWSDEAYKGIVLRIRHNQSCIAILLAPQCAIHL